MFAMTHGGTKKNIVQIAKIDPFEASNYATQSKIKIANVILMCTMGSCIKVVK
jgi:hypothetical protein